MIAWDDPRSEVLLNPRLGAADRAEVERLVAACGALHGHVWLTTSGTTGRLKPVAIGKRALLASADAVNRHLEASAEDVWCRALPPFHVGGLGIHARAFRTGSAVHALEKWDPFAFHALLADESVTLTSLVPAQVRDLVSHGLSSPPSLRAVLVGGGATPPDLWTAGRALGWPMLPNYGATETGAQIATAALTDLSLTSCPPLRLLHRVEARVDEERRLAVRGPSLFSGYATERGLDDPKRDGWWTTGDRGAVRAGILTVDGRVDDTIKVGGESVSLSALQTRLDALRATVPGVEDAALIDTPDPRLGAVLLLAVAGSRGGAEALRRSYDAAVLPFERARDIVMVRTIPRTALGKVRLEALADAARRSAADAFGR